MSFWMEDEGKGILTWYYVYIKGISLDFDSSWTPGSEVRIYGKDRFDRDEVHWYSIHDCPRSLAWDTFTLLDFHRDDLRVDYKGCDGGPSRTCVIAEHGEVEDLALDVEYQCGVAQLEIKRELGFGTSIVRLMVRKISQYHRADSFKLSVVIENINRDEWNKLLEYQHRTLDRQPDRIVDEAPFAWRGNERVIEQMPKSPWQDDRSDVTNDIRHVAHESMAILLKHYGARSEAIQRGLSYDDFQWESPSRHETRIVRSPSAHPHTPLRAIRLDISILSDVYTSAPVASLYIGSIELNLTSITRSPSHPNNLSSCTIRLDPPYAALANATIPNHSSQITKVLTDSQSAERVITTSGPIHVNNTLHIMGDMFAAPIYGGNVGGQNNINNITSSPILNTMVSAVVSAIRSEIHGEGICIPQTGGGRTCNRAQARHGDEAGVDVEPPRKRRTRQSRA